MCLLHKGVQFETIDQTLLDIRKDLSVRSGEANITAPAIELPDGRFLFDSYRIALWLEEAFPSRPSLFTGDGQTTSQAHPAHVETGKRYARMIDLGLGASKPEWAVWFDLFFPRLDQLMRGDELRQYFTSDSRLGPSGYDHLMSLDREELTRRAQLNVQPLIEILREGASDYLQGTSPGFVDYVLFGRYAYCRMLDARLAKQIWNDQGMEIDRWIQRLSMAFDGHAQKIFDKAEKQ